MLFTARITLSRIKSLSIDTILSRTLNIEAHPLIDLQASLIFAIRRRRYEFVDASAVCIFNFYQQKRALDIYYSDIV